MAHGRPWYKRDGSALIMATLGFPSAEHKWAYSAIIDMLNDRDRALPDEPGFICGFTGLSKRKWSDVRRFLIDGGYLVERGGELSNPRFDRERQEREADAAQARENGRKGGRKSAALRAAGQAELPLPESENDENGCDFSSKTSVIFPRFREENSEIIDPEMAENSHSASSPPQAIRAREEVRDKRIEESTTDDVVLQPARATPFDRGEILALTQSCARAGGVTLQPQRPQAMVRELDIVKAWLDDGVDIEKTAIPTIATAVARLGETETVGSLRFYDGRVRKAHARTLGGDGAPRGPSAFDDEAARRAYLDRMNGGSK